jgi:hypothetical protein
MHCNSGTDSHNSHSIEGDAEFSCTELAVSGSSGFSLEAVHMLPKAVPRNESSERRREIRKSVILTDTLERKLLTKQIAVVKRKEEEEEGK